MCIMRGCVALLQVQEAENKLNVPKDAEEQPVDVNYFLSFSMSYLIIKFSFKYNYNACLVKSNCQYRCSIKLLT